MNNDNLEDVILDFDTHYKLRRIVGERAHPEVLRAHGYEPLSKTLGATTMLQI